MIFFLYLLILYSFYDKAQANDYIWPLEGQKRLSSVFGDHRPFRFHSGIDIPTRKKKGLEVFACQSGYVYRIFTSWWGYGKAVYLKLDDGRLAVYGHLLDFSKKISERVTARQIQTKDYHTDFLLNEKEIRIKRGELIGYSGESGWGGPHLHFELRDSSGCPINPLTSGFFVRDRLPPVMEYLAIRPLSLEAKIDGFTELEALPLIFDADKNIYHLQKTPVADGKIGLELSVYDKMERSGFRFGIYRLELYLDDSLIFASRYDRIRFENTHKIEIDRDFELRKKQGKEFYKLYVEEGGDLPIYELPGGEMEAGALKSGHHRVEIKAFDASGNFSTLSFSLIFDRSPLILTCLLERDNRNRKLRVQFEDSDDVVQEVLVERTSLDRIAWEEIRREKINKSDGEYIVNLGEGLNKPVLLRTKIKDTFGSFSKERYFVINADQIERREKRDSLTSDFEYVFQDNFFIFDLRFNQILKEVSKLALRGGGFEVLPLLYEQTKERSYRVIFPFFLKDQREMTLSINCTNLYGESFVLQKTIPISIITQSDGGFGLSPDGQAKVEFDPYVVYRDINISIQSVKTKLSSKHKLVGNIYSFEPSTVPFNGWAKISLRYPQGGCNPHRVGIYELIGENFWKFIDNQLDTLNQTIEGKVRYLSTYALLEDTLAPKISKVSISPGEKIKDRMPRITARVKDDLSGWGSEEDIQIQMDGVWMIPEYDPEKKSLSARPVFPLTTGEHLLTISAKDRAGNQSKIERRFFVTGK